MNPPVFVRAAGVVSAAGTGVAALVGALEDHQWRPRLGLDRPDAPPLPVAPCRDFSTRDVLSPLVARRLDRPSRLLAVAAREAAVAVGEPLPWDRTRVGVCMGTWTAGTGALVEVLRSVFELCPEEAPPAQFPSTVANAPASQLGILEKLGGANITFAEKQVAGLRALAEAAVLVQKGRVDAVFAGGVDEAHWIFAEGYDRLGTLRRTTGPGMVLAEGAAVVVLSQTPGGSPLARLAGWGSAGVAAVPYHYPSSAAALTESARHALARAAVSPDQVDLVISLANGMPRLHALERTACEELFGSHRPAVVALSDRLGEGAVAGATRALAGALAIGGRLRPAWGPPAHLAAAGFKTPAARPRTVLVTGVAGGGSSVALVFTAA
jgi:3-oxoacyl-[acyl-carrier-protein] synthase II